MKRSTYSRWQCSKCLYAPKFSNYIAFNNHRRICSTFTNLNGSQKQFVSINDFSNNDFGIYNSDGSHAGDDELAVQHNLINASNKKSKLFHGVSSINSSQSYSEFDVDNNNFSIEDDLNSLSNHNFIDNKYISFQRKFLSLTKSATTHEQEDINSFDNHDNFLNVGTNNLSSIGSQKISGLSSKLSLGKVASVLPSSSEKLSKHNIGDPINNNLKNIFLLMKLSREQMELLGFRK